VTIETLAMLAVHALTFACGLALLSHKVYAVYRRRFVPSFGYRSHIPGVVGVALMLVTVVSAAVSGWLFALATVLAGYALSPACVRFFQWRIETAIVGPVLALFLVTA
jgi:hypothetical protein